MKSDASTGSPRVVGKTDQAKAAPIWSDRTGDALQAAIGILLTGVGVGLAFGLGFGLAAAGAMLFLEVQFTRWGKR